METPNTWTNFHSTYPRARLTCYQYDSANYVGMRMFEVEVLKMLQQYQMSVHFCDTELCRVEGTNVTPMAIVAVQQVNGFLVTMVN